MNVCIDWHQKWGPAEMWVWAVIAGLALANLIVAKSEDTKTQTVFQLVVNSLLSKYGAVSILGSILRVLAARYPANPPISFTTAPASNPPTNPPAAPPPAAAALIIFGLLSSGMAGCAGARVVTYTTLTAITEGTTAAAEKLPGACETAEMAVAKKQPTQELKVSESGKIHLDCQATAKALGATHDGLIAARNFAVNYPNDPKSWPKWVLSAIQLYEDLRPLVAKYGIDMPEVK